MTNSSRIISRLIPLVLSAMFALPAFTTAAPPGVVVPDVAQDRVAVTQLRVSPDRPGWTYQPGEKVTFKVTALWDEEPLDGLVVRYRVGPEKMPAEEKTAALPRGGLLIDGGTLDQPGFLRCVVLASVNGKTIRTVANAGFAPGKISPVQEEPADFDQFWADGKKALAQIPLDAQLTLMADASNESINVYHVSFATLSASGRGTARLYGILCEPKAAGKYPALLRLPGAGVRSYDGDRAMAAKGFITLQIGIHGIPVNLPSDVYTSLAAGALENYPAIRLDLRDAYYYRRVYLGCVRANDFLVRRSNWDQQNLFVSGGSQGGQLSLVTAGLDSRVTRLAVFCPAFCDVTAYLHGRAGGWPHFFHTEQPGPMPAPAPEKVATTAYYDAVNFAKRVRVPGFYSWGYNDDVCPPTSMFAAYNVITAPKQLLLAVEMGHTLDPAQTDRANAWLIEQIKK